MGERDGFVRAVMLEDLAEEAEVARGGGQEGAVSASCGACRNCSGGETRASTVLCLVSGRLGDSHPFLTQSHVSILG